MAATTLGAYLIVARYNRGKWDELSQGQRDEANRAAEEVFPEHNTAPTSKGAEPAEMPGSDVTQSAAPPADEGIALPVLETVPIPNVYGVRMMRAFHSGIHGKIPSNFTELPEDAQAKTLRAVFEDFRNKRITAPGVPTEDPGIGWVAVVDAEHFDQFVAKMGGKDGPLWNIYDITLIPLNDDRTTKHVYDYMTPVSWNKR